MSIHKQLDFVNTIKDDLKFRLVMFMSSVTSNEIRAHAYEVFFPGASNLNKTTTNTEIFRTIGSLLP